MTLFWAWMKELESLKLKNEAKSLCQMCWYIKKKSLSDSLPSKLNLKIHLRIRNWGTTEVDQRELFLYYSIFLSSVSWEPESSADPGCWWHSWDLCSGISATKVVGLDTLDRSESRRERGGWVWEGFWKLWCVQYEKIGERYGGVRGEHLVLQDRAKIRVGKGQG